MACSVRLMLFVPPGGRMNRLPATGVVPETAFSAWRHDHRCRTGPSGPLSEVLAVEMTWSRRSPGYRAATVAGA